MMSLSEQVKNLENKADKFDDAIERIVSLKSDIREFENGNFSQNGLIQSFKLLISFYERESKAFKEKLEADGFQEGELKKYVNSKFNGEKINLLKAMNNGDIYAITKSGQYLLNCMDDNYNFMQDLDYLLCGIQGTSGLELIK